MRARVDAALPVAIVVSGALTVLLTIADVVSRIRRPRAF